MHLRNRFIQEKTISLSAFMFVAASWGACTASEKTVEEPADTQTQDSETTPDSSDIGVSVDISTTDMADVQPVSWCESFCASLSDGCPEGEKFSDKDCLGECVASPVGDCAEPWKAVEACLSTEMSWSCGDAGHAAPSDGVCKDELAGLRECLGPPNPCEPTPCGAHETCILDEEGEVYCSSDAEQWCTAITTSMKEACPDYLKNPEMHIALCIQNAEGPCALECAIVRDCVPTDTEWTCDPEKGIVPVEGICMDELMTMYNCTMANGSVP